MQLMFQWPEFVPVDQVSQQFIQGMLDRMAVGFHNYGHVLRKYARPDNLRNISIRIEKYLATGNTEFLMDAANYCMMEFMVPSVAEANFKPTESHESPGSIVAGRLIKGKHELPTHHVRQPKEGD